MSTATRSRLDIIVPRIRARDPQGRYIPMLPWGERHPGDVRPKPTMCSLSLSEVTGRSPIAVRRAVETLARYFQREFRYDFIQYSANQPGDSRDHTFLWTRDDVTHHEGVGAICFRWREYSNVPHGLAVAWVWIHPYLRRQRILASHWDCFRRVYGDFYVEPPLSSAMKAFLESRGECCRCGRTCHCTPESERREAS
jgi:hypothetical protein